MPDNNMGDLKLITKQTFEEAAKAAGQSVEETEKNVYEYLKKELEKRKNSVRGILMSTRSKDWFAMNPWQF